MASVRKMKARQEAATRKAARISQASSGDWKTGQSRYAKKRRGEAMPGPAQSRASWFVREGWAAGELARFAKLEPLKLGAHDLTPREEERMLR